MGGVAPRLPRRKPWIKCRRYLLLGIRVQLLALFPSCGVQSHAGSEDFIQSHGGILFEEKRETTQTKKIEHIKPKLNDLGHRPASDKSLP